MGVSCWAEIHVLFCCLFNLWAVNRIRQTQRDRSQKGSDSAHQCTVAEMRGVHTHTEIGNDLCIPRSPYTRSCVISLKLLYTLFHFPSQHAYGLPISFSAVNESEQMSVLLKSNALHSLFSNQCHSVILELLKEALRINSICTQRIEIKRKQMVHHVWRGFMLMRHKKTVKLQLKIYTLSWIRRICGYDIVRYWEVWVTDIFLISSVFSHSSQLKNRHICSKQMLWIFTFKRSFHFTF